MPERFNPSVGLGLLPVPVGHSVGAPTRVGSARTVSVRRKNRAPLVVYCVVAAKHGAAATAACLACLRAAAAVTPFAPTAGIAAAGLGIVVAVSNSSLQFSGRLL